MGSFVWGSFADELDNIIKKASVKAVENNKRVDAQVLYFIKSKCREVASKCEDGFSITLCAIGENVDDWYVLSENFDNTIPTQRAHIMNLVIEELGIKAGSTVHGDGITVTWRKDDDNE